MGERERWAGWERGSYVGRKVRKGKVRRDMWEREREREGGMG